MAITWLLLRRRPGERARQQHHGRGQAAGARAVRRRRRDAHRHRRTTCRSRPNGWRGIHQGAAIVFFAYIGFDAISTAAEETKNPQRNMPHRHSGRARRSARSSTSSSGRSRPGSCRTTQLKAADPLARALTLAGLPTASWIVALGAVVSLTAVLLVFQYGQPRIFFAMARDGLLPQWAAKIHPKYAHAAHHDARDRASSSQSARCSPTRTRSTT